MDIGYLQANQSEEHAMSDHYTDGRHWDDQVQGWALDDDPYEDALLSREDLKARIAELEAHAEHDEDNLEGLQHALVRANQQYTQAEVALAERDRTVGRLKATIGILRAHIDDGTERCSVCRGVIAGYDLRARDGGEG